MRKPLKLSELLSLPIETVTQSLAILAKRRAGKSYTARRLAEQLYGAGQQIVIVDPKGDWWGIRSSRDGKSPGLPIVIIGGERGDVPLEAGSGEVVAKLVVEERVSVLIDLSLLRKYQVTIFMTFFLETLYRLKAQERFRTPMMLFIDEADAIAPQRPISRPGDREASEARMLGAAEDIVRRGGQRGIGCCLITQRTAVLNKNVLTQCEMIVTLRTIAPQDLAAIGDWVDVHGTKEQLKLLKDSLPSLPTGDAWFWSPGWPTEEGIFQRVHVLPIDTFDSGATPKAGEKRVEPKNLADVDLAALTRQMAETIEKAKAENPRELQARILELESELEKKGEQAEPAEVWEVDLDAVREVSYGEGYKDGVQAENERLAALVEIGRSTVHTAFVELQGRISISHAPAPQMPAAPKEVRKPKPAPPPRDHDKPHPPDDDNHRRPAPTRGKGNAAQAILDAMAGLEAMGLKDPPRTQVGFLAGYSHVRSKAFVDGLGELLAAGHIIYPAPGAIALTDSGRSAARPSNVPRTNGELHELIISKLGTTAGKVLAPLVAAYPNSIARQTVAEKAGYGHVRSAAFVEAIGKLHECKFIDYPAPGFVCAKSAMFPFRR